MATAVVLAWQLQLFLHGNYSCPGRATTVVQGWQLQLLIHGNCSCPVMATAVVNYAPSANSPSATSLFMDSPVYDVDGRYMGAAWCHVLHEGSAIFPDTTRESFAILCKFIFHAHTSMFHFSYALPWFATLASWSWLPVHLSVLAPYDWTCHGAPLSVFWS